MYMYVYMHVQCDVRGEGGEACEGVKGVRR